MRLLEEAIINQSILDSRTESLSRTTHIWTEGKWVQKTIVDNKQVIWARACDNFDQKFHLS